MIQKLSFILSIGVAALVIASCTGNKFDEESFSPSNLDRPVISDINANGGDTRYCSISGGCPLIITGKNFFTKAQVFIGNFPCLDQVINAARTQISCTAGPAQNGVYDIKVMNADGKSSVLDPSVTDQTLTQFSYTSFLYLGSQDSPGKVYGYAQHPTSGALLNIVGSPFSISSENGTYGVVIHPNNKYIYAANVGSGTVSGFAINPYDGKLTSIMTPITSGAGSPNGLFFHPSGNFLYVTNQSGNSVTGFTVDSSGVLTSMGTPFAAGASTINGLVVSSDGHFLYAAAMGGNGGVVAYTINQSTGALTLIPGSPFMNTLGGDSTNPGDGISIHPNGKWLYMGLVNIRKISVWSINNISGALTPVEAPILNNSPTGFQDDGGSASTVSADGLFLYGTAFTRAGGPGAPKKVVVYGIDQTTGGLTRLSNVDTGGGPNDIRIDTTGNFAYTCNSRNTASVSAFAVNKTTGALTPLSPQDYTIPGASTDGPGIMVIQRNLQSVQEAPESQEAP